MSAKLMGTIIQEVNLPDKEKWTLTILVNYYNEKIGDAYPSIETISKNAGLSRSSIIRALTSLKEQGLITVKKRRRSGRFSQNVITFTWYPAATCQLATWPKIVAPSIKGRLTRGHREPLSFKEIP